MVAIVFNEDYDGTCSGVASYRREPQEEKRTRVLILLEEKREQRETEIERSDLHLNMFEYV